MKPLSVLTNSGRATATPAPKLAKSLRLNTNRSIRRPNVNVTSAT